MRLILALLAALTGTLSTAQPADTPPAASSTAAPPPAYLFNAEKAAMRCEQAAS